MLSCAAIHCRTVAHLCHLFLVVSRQLTFRWYPHSRFAPPIRFGVKDAIEARARVAANLEESGLFVSRGAEMLERTDARMYGGDTSRSSLARGSASTERLDSGRSAGHLNMSCTLTLPHAVLWSPEE